MKLNPVLQIRESETTLSIRFLNNDPFAILKKNITKLSEKEYKPIIEKLCKDRGLTHPYLEDNINYKILENLLETNFDLSIRELISLSNQLISMRIRYSTLEDLNLNDLSQSIDLLILDINPMIDVIPHKLDMIKKDKIKRIIFISRNDNEYLVGPLVRTSEKICYNCLLSAVIQYKDQIISVENNADLLASQIIEFILNKNLFTNFLSNGQLMMQNGTTNKTSYRIPYETTNCEFLLN